MIRAVWNNSTLWVAVLAWFAAGMAKVFIRFAKARKFNIRLVASSGGMPSSHSAFVTAAAVFIGMTEGFDTPLFALATIISLVVMYDASGVRRAAGKHASVLNMIIDSFENPGEFQDEKLKELLGHSPMEVVLGAPLGAIVAVVCAM